MVQVITREWEIVKTYVFDVVLREGFIGLDWNDFEMKARESRPTVVVKVDEPNSIAELTITAVEKIKKNIKGNLSGLIVSLLFKKGNEITMEELDEMTENIRSYADDNVEIVWGCREADDITNSRSMTLFAFEKL